MENYKFEDDVEYLSSDEEQILGNLVSAISTPSECLDTNADHRSNYDHDTKGQRLCTSQNCEDSEDSIIYSTESVKNSSANERSSLSTDIIMKTSRKRPRKRSGEPDVRSPFLRFRSRAHKGLTVTDLISPAWCEMKYWYTLSSPEVLKPTPAMERGNRIHKNLEKEIHTLIPVKVHIREDTLGLKIWNMIQGLRTLRAQGLTREFQVWGIVDNKLVGGKIDEISYTNPITDISEHVEGFESDENKSTCRGIFADDETSNADVAKSIPPSPSKNVYICDVKTRSTRSLPSEVTFRPTKYQLMLYHRFLSAITSGQFDLEVLTTFYKLDSSRTFSDSFIAQLCCLDENQFHDSEISKCSSTTQSPRPLILDYNNLSSLWSLMLAEFRKSFPDGPASLSTHLKVEYRSGEDGNIIGTKTFLMNEPDLTAYLKHLMEWWRGERMPEGVVLEEAYKCRNCEFADICEWRLKKVEDDRKLFKLRKELAENIRHR
ncbi:Exonuclease V [Golovinomyces cichoracearum]|uniref:Exonuclease V n=1 Tax=Golovinomyces cichoracearum TaxID=62708 RepID=A0A420HNE2_9PEZI|nr:Exonuclease V [Golovinomyces cichoracearum]